MQNFSISPKELFSSLWRNRSLAKALIDRDIESRYRGSVLGIFWSFFNPVLLLVVYTLVFSVVFKSRWIGGSDSKLEFSLILFSGLIIFTLFSECFNRSSSLIINNANYVKKVVFPLEILPLVALGSALFHAVVSLGVWLIVYLIFFGIPYITILLVPLALLPLLFVIMGLTWGLASLGVYYRDVSHFTGVTTTILLFLSPIFFPASALPELIQDILIFNPLLVPIEQIRDLLFWGKVPDITTWFAYSLFALVVAWLGFAWFQKTRKGFSDVL